MKPWAGAKAKTLIKDSIAAIGSAIAPSIRGAEALHRWLEMGRWMRLNDCRPKARLCNREQVFDAVARDVAERQVLYLEFGVFRGETMGYWSRALLNPASVLHGFDTFEGLPERWNGCPTGFFSTGGQIPSTSDPRVRFFKGRFEEILPAYVLPSHETLVVTCDADLYTSTRCVLSRLRDEIRVGTYLYFDEFCDLFHEFRAFDEFVRDTGMRFELIAESNDMTCVAFRRIA